jgi:PAS domain S-box-containing protein
VAAFPYCLRWDAGGLITATGPGWGARGREWVGQRWDRIFRRQPGPGIRAGGEPEVLTLAALAAATPSLHGPRLAQPDGGSLFLGTPLPPDPGPEPRRSERRTLLTDSRRPPAGTCLRLVEAVWQCLTAAGGAPDLLASLPASLGQPAGASLVQVFQLGPDGRPDLPLAEWTAPGLTAEPLAALRAQLDARRKVSLASGLYSLEGVVPGPAPQLVVLAFPLGDGQSGLVLLALPAEAGRVAEAEASVPLLGQLLGQCLGRNRAERAWADERSLTQNVLELMGQGLTVSDGSGRWIFVNSAYARLAGRSVDELVGSQAEALAAPEDLPVLAEARRLRGLGQANTYEMSVVRPDGSRREVLVSGVPRCVDGKFVGSIATTTDLTPIKETKRRIRAALVREQELNLEKNTFMRMATHEYRTPVATITYAAELLGMRLAELGMAVDPQRMGRIQRHAQLIRESALQMSRLLDNLILLWRLQAQDVQVLPKRVGVGSLIEELLRVAGQAGRLERLRLVVEPTAPETFPLDTQMLRLVLLNLLDNALKYSPADQPVTVRLSQPAGGPLHLAVEDRGPGISPEDQGQMFNAFYRGSNVLEQSGTGIGLTIARRCARLCGGDLVYRPGESAGGVFLATVPEVVPPACPLVTGS